MENQLITIASFSELFPGSFVKEKFETEGIECFLTDEGFIKTDESGPKGLKLKVRANDSEKAIKVLLQIHKEYDLENLDQDSLKIEKLKILVPVDLSEYSFNACRYAFGIAKKTNAEIKLLYVYEDPCEDMPEKHTTSWEYHNQLSQRQAYSIAQEKLLAFSNNIKEFIPKHEIEQVKFHYTLLKGRPENVIDTISKRYNPNIILMGFRGKSENTKAYIGSVTTKIIEHVNIPILVIPQCSGYQGINTINVMYATNFNEADNTSLNKLLHIMSPFETKIRCIHLDLENDPLKLGKVDELNMLLKSEYSEYNILCELFEANDMIQGLEEFIYKNDIDLISFSNPKRTLFYRIFHPNKLKKLVSTCRVPMLVFPV